MDEPPGEEDVVTARVTRRTRYVELGHIHGVWQNHRRGDHIELLADLFEDGPGWGCDDGGVAQHGFEAPTQRLRSLEVGMGVISQFAVGAEHNRCPDQAT